MKRQFNNLKNKSGKTHKLTAGVLIIKDDKVLLVKDHNGWGLPKGGAERGESLMETAIREAKEESGFDVKIGDLSFVSEFRTQRGKYYAQTIYTAEITGGTMGPMSTDDEIEDVKFISLEDLHQYYIKSTQLIPLEDLRKGELKKYYFFDLKKTRE